jgi:hypothetical protein
VPEKVRNNDGFVIREELHKTEAFAEEKGIKRAEFYAAAREGITLSKMMTVDKYDFETATVEIEGKKTKPSRVEHDGITYRILRTYIPENSMRMELYLQEEENG